MEQIAQFSNRLDEILKIFESELKTIRTDRVSPYLLDKIFVNYNGARMAINQVATVSTPEARLIVIQPWDPSVLPFIEKAILASDLSLNPASDGKFLRLKIPPLSAERRKELIKNVHDLSERFRVEMRNHRRTIIDRMKKLSKEKTLSEDDLKRHTEIIQKTLDQFILKINQSAQQHEKSILGD